MDISEIKILKNELEKIIPGDILNKSKDISDHLSASVEDYKRIQNIVSNINEKVLSIKKTFESDLEELSIKRSKFIDESNVMFNERTDKIKIFEKTISQKENQIGSLELTALEINSKINATQKNLDSFVLEKNQISQEISEFVSYLNQRKTEEQEIKNTTKVLVDLKNVASKALSEVQDLVEEERKKLQMITNEIIIAQSRKEKLI